MKPAVLFLCTGNSARSQMAEGLLRREAGEHFEAYSAGPSPSFVNPLAIQVMNEAGINITSHRSKHLIEFQGMPQIQYVIVVCSETDKACPTSWAGIKKRLVWPIADPCRETEALNQKVQQFRRCRDELWDRIRRWVKEPGVIEAL